MSKTRFEWDPDRGRDNQKKHGIPFELVQYAFADPNRLILKDLGHSEDESRYYCMGRIDDGIVTVRFTYRDDIIRIFGAGYWRKGKNLYEKHR